VLAAGASRRLGRQKLLERIDGRSLVARAIDAAANWPTVVVASDAVAAELRASGADARVTIVRNVEPDRGMNHSLTLANAVIPSGEPIAVLLGDLPDCDAATIARVVGAYDDGVDVLVPQSGERRGHPVVFGPAARRAIATLGDGDGLQRLRDAEGLRRRTVPIDNPGAFEDIDTEEELASRIARGIQPNA
jgi:molybdenum cofactor cytidylyltransferase